MVDTKSQTWTIEDLETLVNQQEWQAADQVTQALLLQSVGQQQVGYLTPLALAQIPCNLLHQIDHRWRTASQGLFGFSLQNTIYTTMAHSSAYIFCQQVGWLMPGPRPLSFFKFYDFLNFSLDAPKGHLPALWYWRMSWAESWRSGGFGTGRGGAYANHTTLDALMLRLSRCSLQ
jgi:hypothetical protein